jgi:hypothetical protein
MWCAHSKLAIGHLRTVTRPLPLKTPTLCCHCFISAACITPARRLVIAWCGVTAWRGVHTARRLLLYMAHLEATSAQPPYIKQEAAPTSPCGVRTASLPVAICSLPASTTDN